MLEPQMRQRVYENTIDSQLFPANKAIKIVYFRVDKGTFIEDNQKAQLNTYSCHQPPSPLENQAEICIDKSPCIRQLSCVLRSRKNRGSGGYRAEMFI